MNDFEIWLEKSTENLLAAEVCFKGGHFNACANRLYYAMFQAGIAALEKFRVKLPEKVVGHGWVQATFSEQLIRRRKIFPAKFSSYLTDAYRVREIADYRMSSISKKVVSRELRKANEFLASIKKETGYETYL